MKQNKNKQKIYKKKKKKSIKFIQSWIVLNILRIHIFDTDGKSSAATSKVKFETKKRCLCQIHALCAILA